jgi:gamma-glutamyltranspeptidase / glutathione hydrolase
MTISETRTRRETFKRSASADRGMVTSNHPLASLAGVELLTAGGNAVDAAIGTMFALSVVEPMMTTIFGAGFINMRLADGTITTIDNYATVPMRARPDMYTPIPGSLDNDTEGELNSTGYLAVATGGSLLGWTTAVERYGRLPLSRVVAPAVRFARDGFRVSPYLRAMIVQCQEPLARFPDSADVFLPDGAPPAVGDTIRRPDYGDTLEIIGVHGSDYLYRGPLGRAIVDDMARNRGLITMEDLGSYRIYERAPVRGEYRGYEVVSTAPTSSGGTHIIQVLNILEGFDIARSGFGSPVTIHLIAEAMKIAFADRFRYMADPERVDVPVDWLASKEYAAERRGQIDRGRARQYAAADAPDGEGECTTHCCAADAEGNIVTTTQTLNNAFGSRVTVPGTGMLLNNCMHLMDPTPGRTNSIEPGKRILSSMSPTLLLKDGEPVLAIGTPGGVRIFGAVMQAILNLVDHHMTLQEAVEAPRVWSRGPVLEVERGMPDLQRVKRELEQFGHVVETPLKVAGGMNGIWREPETGMLHGAACWRADGVPMGFSGGDAIVNEETFEAGVPV